MAARRGPATGVFTIDPGLPFVDALAHGLLAEAGDDPLALADVRVLLPTRRACRALHEAFLRRSAGRPLLLPAMQPLGEVDEDELVLDETPGLDVPELPPAISHLRRLLLLTRLILVWESGAVAADQAARYARELARLIDQVQTEGLSFEGLARLVPEDYALHWQRTLAFLRIVTERWPDVLASEGRLDPADRRNRLLEARAEAWRRSPPTQRIVAAGSTGSIPATARLLEVVARLPRGAVVLPGLDREMDERTRAAAAAAETHPQFGMLRLLERLGLSPEEVADWPAPGMTPASSATRRRLVAEALRPAETTEAWRSLPPVPKEAFGGVVRIDCPGEAEEAGVIALVLRRALEGGDGRTAALVTPDRRLARRVAAELRRWNVEVDDSAGVPLSETPPGIFFRLVAEMVAARFAPVALLAALKHPFAAAGESPGRFRAAVRALERVALRGPRPAPGLASLRRVIRKSDASEAERARALAVIGALEDRLRPFVRAMRARRRRLGALVEAHIAAAEALAATAEESGAERLWAGEAGEALAAFFLEAREAAEDLPAIEPDVYPQLLATMMGGYVVRPRYGRHPRLHIWGPLEARLQHADLVVLGGLNEGTWPREVRADPWLSRPMQRAFGLPLPERRVGLAAHDFAQSLAAAEVVLTRAEKVDGTPTVPSRWLMRLDAVLRAVGLEDALAPADPWLGWQRALARPDRFERVAPPAPRPPVAARPRQLSVTRIETWMRDPYSIYARYVLGLAPLDPLDADPGAAERGQFIHEALDRFQRAFPKELPEDALSRLLEFGRRAFGGMIDRPAVASFWWPRFERIARWFVEHERDRRVVLVESASERHGRLVIEGPAGPFVLTAVADRIDRLLDGGYAIVDYKTGAVPSKKQVEAGHAPQLPLEAVIAAEGGFEGLAPGSVRSLELWRLSGAEPPGERAMLIEERVAELAARARAALADLVAAFDDPRTPYHAVPDPARAPRFNDYEHLARLREWSASNGGAAE